MRSTRQGGRVRSLPLDAPAAQACYFDDVFAAFLNAERLAGSIARDFLIGGGRIRVRFAGDALVSLLSRALAHLSCDASAEPDLTICVWDSASTGVALPDAPATIRQFLARREMSGVSGERFIAAFDFAERMRLSVLYRQQRAAIHWIPDAPSIPFYEQAAPFLQILHWWAREHRHQIVHAAAVGTAAGGVLIGGKSGSGKSTTTLTCLKAGLRSPGDDYTLLCVAQPPLVRSLYSTGKLEGPHLLRSLPSLMPAVSNQDRMHRDKAVLFLHEHYPEALIGEFPVRAVVLPRISAGGRCRLIETSPAAAVAAIAPSTMIQLRWSGSEDLRRIAAVVRAVPNYILELGDDLDEIPVLIRGLLEKAA